MTAPRKPTPPSSDPKPGSQPGYAEPKPRDRHDARQPHPRKPPNPDEGGMERDPGTNPAGPGGD